MPPGTPRKLSVLDGLPPDLPRPTCPTFAVGTRVVRTDPALSATVRGYADRSGVPTELVWLAGYVALLHRYAGRDDVSLVVTGGDDAPVPTGPLLVDVSGTPGLAELIARLEVCGPPEGDPADIVSAFDAGRPCGDGPGPGPVANLRLRPAGDSIVLDYRSELYSAAAVDRFGDHLLRALAAALDDDKRPVAELPLLGPQEWEHATVTLARGPQPDEPPATIHARLARQAQLRPDATALEMGTEQVSFAELDRRSTRIARSLHRRGVRPETLVGLCVNRGPDMVVAMLGIFKAGGAYVPLHPEHPRQRLAELLDDARPALVVAPARLAHLVPVADTDVVTLEALEAGPEQVDGELPPVPPDNLAYVIYTSGSTGRPKGVMMEHRAVTNLMSALLEPYRLGPHLRMLQFASFTFDASVLEIFPVLGVGGTMVFPTPGQDAVGPELLDLIRTARINAAQLPPSVLSTLPDDDVPDLANVYTGSETCTLDTAERWSRGRHFANAYGPTENAVLASVGTVLLPDRPPPIGRPLAGVELLVVDPLGAPVPVGVVGELYIGGRGLARGYLNREELTREKFVPNPLPGRSADRMYRSGDLVRWLPDGELEFVGRADSQVKIRGYRVELGEIEHVLAEEPEVRSCAVVPHGEGPQAQLIGFVVLTPGAAPETPELLRTRLADRLPHYLVPSVLVRMDALPTNNSRKIDRAALRRQYVRSRPAHLTYRPCADGYEWRLAELWAEMLDVRPVGRDDGFLALGGTSLQAAGALARITATFGVRVTVPEFFGARTLTDLAALVRQRHTATGTGENTATAGPASAGTPASANVENGSASAGPGAAVDGWSDGGSRPASRGEKRLWLLGQLSRQGSVAYNEPLALWIRGPLDVDALRYALGDLTARHDALRTGFQLQRGDLAAVVAAAEPGTPVALPVVDVSTAADPHAEALRRAGLLAGEPIDLSRPPLARVALVRLGPDVHLFLLVLHHLVCDGWSANLIDADLARAYGHRAAGQPGPVRWSSPRPANYADLVGWQAQRAADGADERDAAHWSAELDGAPTTLTLPSTRPRPARFSYQGGKVRRTLPQELRDAVAHLARAHGVTPYTVFLSAYGLLLHELTGAEDLLVGSSAAGRPTVELERTVGFFANTMPLRLRPRRGLSVAALLGEVQVTALRALEYQYVPFERMAAGAARQGDMSRNPLVQVFFAYQGQQRPEAALDGLTVEPAPIDRGAAKLDFVLEVEDLGRRDEPAGCLLTGEYATDLYDADTVAGWLDRYVSLMERVVATPDTVVGDLLHGS